MPYNTIVNGPEHLGMKMKRKKCKEEIKCKKKMYKTTSDNSEQFAVDTVRSNNYH